MYLYDSIYYMVITDKGVRLDLPMTDSLHRRNTVTRECYLILGERDMEYKTVADYEADDYHEQEGIWKDVKSNYRWTRRRTGLVQVDMYYDNPEGMWTVSVEFSGISNQTGWLFNDPKEALVVYKRLSEYMITCPASQ